MADSSDVFDFDLRRGAITGLRGTVKLEPRAAQVLEILLERAGTVVGRDELLDNVWHGRVVTDAALTGVISQLRRALKAAGVTHLEIATHSKRGYSLERHSEAAQAPLPRMLTKLVVAVLAVIVLGLALGRAWFAWNPAQLTSLDGVRLDFDITTANGESSRPVIWLRDGSEGSISIDGAHPLDLRVLPALTDTGLLRLRIEAVGFSHWTSFEQEIGLDTVSRFTLRSEIPGEVHDIRFVATRVDEDEWPQKNGPQKNRPQENKR